MKKELTKAFELEKGLIDYEEQKIEEYNEILNEYLLEFDYYYYADDDLDFM